MLMTGYEHEAGGVAEATISGVLILGVAATFLRPGAARVIGLATQVFALLGASVGVSSMVRGFGPRSAADLAFHVGVLTVLVAGLIVVWRSSEAGRSQETNSFQRGLARS